MSRSRVQFRTPKCSVKNVSVDVDLLGHPGGLHDRTVRDGHRRLFLATGTR